MGILKVHTDMGILKVYIDMGILKVYIYLGILKVYVYMGILKVYIEYYCNYSMIWKSGIERARRASESGILYKWRYHYSYRILLYEKKKYLSKNHYFSIISSYHSLLPG